MPDGWDVQKYLDAVYAGIDSDTVTEEEYAEMLPEEQAMVYLPEEAQKEKERIFKLAKASTNYALLPQWKELRATYVIANGIVEIPDKLFKLPDNTYYDFEGNLVSKDVAIKAMNDYMDINEGTMSAYQKATLEFDIAEAKRSAGQFQQTLAEQRRQFDITQQRLSVEKTTREKELQFELEREKQLAGWSAPSDWIRRWQLKNQPNPYVPVMLTLQDRAEMGLQAIEAARQQMLQYQGTVPPEQAVLNTQGQWITPYEKRLEEITKEWTPAIKEQQALARETAESGEYPGSNRPPETPPAPAWLSQFAPGQAEGRPITAQNIVTPSGQQWARTPWSVREGVRGYAQWAQGKPYEEVIEEMESMLPFSPRGITSRRWIPTRQMV